MDITDEATDGINAVSGGYLDMVGPHSVHCLTTAAILDEGQ